MSGRRSGSGWSRDLALSELDEKKKALENSRQHLQNEIDRIDYNLKQIQAEYGMICNESSLFLNLPTEVLCVILDLVASAHRLEDPDTDEKSLLPEVVMSHVCTQLRDVALDYPALWTRFYFFLDNVGSGMSNTLTRFDTYVKRSRSQNLELFLDFTECLAERPPLEERVKLLDRAIKHINRWKIVTLLSDGDLNVEKLFPTLMVASAPNLEYFSYSPSSPDAQNSDVLIQCLKPGLLQGGTPKLRYLLLDSTSLRMPAFDTVTTLRIEATIPDVEYSWESFLTMLSLPLLTNLSIAGDTFICPHNFQFPIISTNNLKHLRYSDNGYMTPMLPFLRAPFLETLLIHGDYELYDDESDIENIDTSYFFPSLQSLTITYTSFISGDSAWRIMQLSKNIDQLTVFKTDNFFEAVLTHTHSITECWPKLSGITANWSSLDLDVLQSLSRFILSRLSIIPPKLWFLKELDDYYTSAFPATYRGIKERCAVELLKDETEMLLLQPSWPPGVGSPDYALRDDPFQKKILY